MHRAKIRQKIRTAKRFGGKYLFNALSVYSSVSRDGSLIHVGRTIYFFEKSQQYQESKKKHIFIISH